MLELALGIVVLTEALKMVVPPVKLWVKPVFTGVLAALGAWVFGLSPLEGLGVWGLSHLLHAIIRLLLAVSDYYRVESVVRTKRMSR